MSAAVLPNREIRNDLSEYLRSGATENRNISLKISGAVLPKEKSVCHLWPVARPYGTLIAMIITIMQGVQQAPIIMRGLQWQQGKTGGR
jgi:hypothetical protein